MKREHRYMVAKYKDVLTYLTEAEQQQLLSLFRTIHIGREDAGKRGLECVCVEDDWPEYEIVWAMITARVDGRGQSSIQTLSERRKAGTNGTVVDCLTSEVAELRAALATPPAQSSGQSLEAAIMALPRFDTSSTEYSFQGERRTATEFGPADDGEYILRADALAMLASQPPAPQATSEYDMNDRELARQIISFMGSSTSGSNEPGADPFAERLAEKLAVWCKRHPTPQASQDTTSISDMCAVLEKHLIKSDELTDCTILYRVTFDQLRSLYDDGRALAAPSPLLGDAT